MARNQVLKKRNGKQKDVSNHISKILSESAVKEPNDLLVDFKTSLRGLSDDQAEERLSKYGLNEAVKEKRLNPIVRLIKTASNPLIILLLTLALVSIVIGQKNSAIILLVMIVLSVTIRSFQEQRADNATQELKAMVSTTATVVRNGEKKEIPLKYLVPGDIIHISAGDIIPADVVLVSAKDLFINQATFTGEALPVEKFPIKYEKEVQNPFDLPNICFMGTNIESGIGVALVVATGKNTFFGKIAESTVTKKMVTSFDKEINQVTLLMVSFMIIMVPLVFLINGLTKHNWLEALLFAVSVAVGLTPEMLPVIVTVNLSKGAINMSKKKVIVKQLSAIQNFGAMDVLCTDKTGTITQGRVILEKHLSLKGKESEQVLHYAYLNSYYQTGLKSLLDDAILKHIEVEEALKVKEGYKKIDEIPFDFVRRKMSVIVKGPDSENILISKGAVEELLNVCKNVRIDVKTVPLNNYRRELARQIVNDLNEDGFRVVALAYKKTPSENKTYTVSDEKELTLLGLLAFLDLPKYTAEESIKLLNESGVEVKILTGDNEKVTQKICKLINLPFEKIMLGEDIEKMSEEELNNAAERTTIFAKLIPVHKERIIKALQKNGHVVGFMGDGINDAPALKTSDVGISVNTAVDIAKESSGIILLENSLLVLADGVVEGRKVFANIIKYIKMAASSNFGNMFSVIGASFLLPFLPMLPIQIILNNMLYDFSQVMIPTDNVDKELLSKPGKWSIKGMRQFIISIGPISSIFDYLTYFIMLYVFNTWNNPTLFHTGWFVESLMTQTLIIHVIRTNKIPFIRSRASIPLTIASILTVGTGIWLTVSPVSSILGFARLPPLYWLLVFSMLLCYTVLTQIVKTLFTKRFPEI